MLSFDQHVLITFNGFVFIKAVSLPYRELHIFGDNSTALLKLFGLTRSNSARLDKLHEKRNGPFLHQVSNSDLVGKWLRPENTITVAIAVWKELAKLRNIL